MMNMLWLTGRFVVIAQIVTIYKLIMEDHVY